MDSTRKFDGYAKDYTVGRPGYAQGLIDCLYERYGISEKSVIADIGSGTGKFAKHLLERGSQVFDDRYDYVSFDHPLFLDKERFMARSLSGSYSLKAEDKEFENYVKAIEGVFDRHSKRGIVSMANQSVAYVGEMFYEHSEGSKGTIGHERINICNQRISSS